MFSSLRIINKPVCFAAEAAINGYAKRAMSVSALAGFEGKNFISIDKLSNEELRGLLDLSKKYRDTYGKKIHSRSYYSSQTSYWKVRLHDLPKTIHPYSRVHRNRYESFGRTIALPWSVRYSTRSQRVHA
mmetsp:Transcript_11095/g.22584  ORF Transcript_11095/g.22584 Transcript_11095/m.22584 type:complete len:130 (+) Transcript_11095:136-525(+)